jgi:ATP-dependent protease ClpP protease subunit
MGPLMALLRVAWIFLMVLLTLEAFGADIRAGLDAEGNDIIILAGPIEEGDAAKIAKLKNELGDYARTRRILAGIHLQSPGGNYREALKIVNIITSTGPLLGTRIDKGHECYSACALIFMAGQGGGGSGGTLSDRRLHYQATLGFHAPYITGVTGQFSGTDIEQTFRAAVLSIRELIKRKLIPQSLLVELLGKGRRKHSL